MKTICTCTFCNFETKGNAKWKAEKDMWEHVKKEHPLEVENWQKQKIKVYTEVNKLLASIPVMYYTEQQGEKHKGSWTI